MNTWTITNTSKGPVKLSVALGGASGEARDAILKRKKALQDQLDSIEKELS